MLRLSPALWSLIVLWVCELACSATCHRSDVQTPATLSDGISMPLVRRGFGTRNTSEAESWLQTSRHSLEAKYYGLGAKNLRARANGDNLLTNQNADSSYFGLVAVGTPPVMFNVILDTGSADMWLASNANSNGFASDIHVFKSQESSTFTALNESFLIKYGSGSAEGVLGRDTVQFAGFEVQHQVFGLVSNVTNNLLDGPVSGLLGLAFESIAASGAKPLWQSLVDRTGTLDSPVMAFYLTRFLNGSHTRDLEPGGIINLGSLNSSLYTGDIEYQSIEEPPRYWTIKLGTITAQGVSLELSTNETLGAIDTGTTLVGGPPAAIAQLYATIPGSYPGNDTLEGYYLYPCSTEVSVSISFGSNGTAWPVSPTDFQLVQLGSDTCVGAFYEINGSQLSSAPAWIFGDTFLKNVYSVFNAGNPPSVGFAALSNFALSLNGVDGPAPTPTIGDPVATVTVTISSDEQTLRPPLWLISACFVIIRLINSLAILS